MITVWALYFLKPTRLFVMLKALNFVLGPNSKVHAVYVACFFFMCLDFCSFPRPKRQESSQDSYYSFF